MKPSKCYRIYLGLKLHLTGRYDIVKYQGRLKISLKAFQERGDSLYFKKIAERRNPFGYILANLLHDPTRHVSEFGEEPYKRYLKVTDSLLYYFEQDIKKFEVVPQNFYNMTPINMYYSGEVQIETLAILDKVFNITSKWDNENPLVSQLYNIVTAYKKLINIEHNEIKNVIRKQVTNGSIRISKVNV